ncbi:uncharacterized protein AAGF69_010781 [Amazona ochrocephala]
MLLLGDWQGRSLHASGKYLEGGLVAMPASSHRKGFSLISKPRSSSHWSCSHVLHEVVCTAPLVGVEKSLKEATDGLCSQILSRLFCARHFTAAVSGDWNLRAKTKVFAVGYSWLEKMKSRPHRRLLKSYHGFLSDSQKHGATQMLTHLPNLEATSCLSIMSPDLSDCARIVLAFT